MCNDPVQQEQEVLSFPLLLHRQHAELLCALLLAQLASALLQWDTWGLPALGKEGQRADLDRWFPSCLWQEDPVFEELTEARRKMKQGPVLARSYNFVVWWCSRSFLFCFCKDLAPWCKTDFRTGFHSSVKADQMRLKSWIYHKQTVSCKSP